MRYRDRRAAGRVLAEHVRLGPGERPVVLALPRGGVPVAYELADALQATLDVLAVRKLGAPHHPEYGIGAVAEDGTGVIDERAVVAIGVSRESLSGTLEREATELRRRVSRYRGERPVTPLRDRTVIVVDDGLATGLTDLAAVRAARALGARKVVVAVPVGSLKAVRRLAEEADAVICPHVPADFGGVGRWYEDFSQVSDAEVVDLLARAGAPASGPLAEGEQDRAEPPRELAVVLGGVRLIANLHMPPRPRGVVLFAHGSGSGRHSPRNATVARAVARAGFAAVLMDLLTEREAVSRANVFDIRRLAERLTGLTRWVSEDQALGGLPLGYFGASTGAAAALIAAARLGDRAGAVISRGGRPDLAADALPAVVAPTLLIVGARDPAVLELNRRAADRLRCPHELAVIPGAGHLFAETGALEAVAELAVRWFAVHLRAGRQVAGRAA